MVGCHVQFALHTELLLLFSIFKIQRSLWWKYTLQFRSVCSDVNNVDQECSEQVQAQLGIVVQDVKRCIQKAGEVCSSCNNTNLLLEKEMASQAEIGVSEKAPFMVQWLASFYFSSIYL